MMSSWLGDSCHVSNQFDLTSQFELTEVPDKNGRGVYSLKEVVDSGPDKGRSQDRTGGGEGGRGTRAPGGD